MSTEPNAYKHCRISNKMFCVLSFAPFECNTCTFCNIIKRTLVWLIIGKGHLLRKIIRNTCPMPDYIYSNRKIVGIA